MIPKSTARAAPRFRKNKLYCLLLQGLHCAGRAVPRREKKADNNTTVSSSPQRGTTTHQSGRRVCWLSQLQANFIITSYYFITEEPGHTCGQVVLECYQMDITIQQLACNI